MNYEIHERVGQIRKDKKLSRAKFSECLGLSEGVIVNIELKRVEVVRELYIELICKEFDINERWLKTGKGEMYINSEINELTNLYTSLANTDDPILKQLAINLPLLPSKDLKSIHDIVESLVIVHKNSLK